MNHPEWVERNYSQGLYPKLQSGLSWTSALVTIPIGQLIYYALVLALTIWILKRIIALVKKRITIWRFLLVFVKNGLFAFSLFYFLFNLTWGLNYHRMKVPEITGIDTTEITTDELIALSDTLANRCNALRKHFPADEELPVDKSDILNKAMNGFRLASEQYEFIQYQVPSVKQVWVPKIMSSFRIGGIYFMFTGEANVNMDPPNFLVPATTCHEMAHQSGFASEDEANFVGYLATQFNPDMSFQYSGNLMAFRYSMRSLYQSDSTAYLSIVENLSEDVKNDLRKNREYWSSFYNPIDPLSDAIYDLFLKANDQKAGIKSYSLVTSLLVGEFRRSGLQLKSNQDIHGNENCESI